MILNLEQEKIAFGKPTGHLLVKGVAGSGKTTVGISRVSYLLDNYCFEPDDRILFATYNRTLINYTSYIFEKLEKEKNQSLMDLLIDTKDRVDIVTIDSVMHKYFRSYCKNNKLSYKIADDFRNNIEIIKDCIAKLKKKYSDVPYLDDKYAGFLLSEIRWIKACKYYNEEEYQSADRLGISVVVTDGPQRLNKNSNARKAIHELMVYFVDEKKKRNYVDFMDSNAIALKEINKDAFQKYTHIIIDECQDLTRVQLEFLAKMYKEKTYSSITFLYDTAQSIYPTSWLGPGRPFTTIGFNMAGKSKSLSKNYRTTTQISRAAYSLFNTEDTVCTNENFVKPGLIDKQGDRPVYRYLDNFNQQIEFVVDLISNKLTDISKNEIAIVSRNKTEINKIHKVLKERHIPSDIIDRNNDNFGTNNVKLFTMHSIKGLEFKVIIVASVNKGIIPFYTSLDEDIVEAEKVNEKKLLYVAMTRATERLYMLSYNEQSQFMDEMDMGLFSNDDSHRIKTFYNISDEQYRKKNKIVNIYSSEEKIRQWLLNELINTYKYPEGLIDIELPVTFGSRKGYADLVVYRYEGKKKVPFIIGETKAYSCENVEKHFEQLKSYMECTEYVNYGILTNGKEVIVYDKTYDYVEDIPVFDHSMLQNDIEYYEFLDWKSKNRTRFYKSMKAGTKVELEIEDHEYRYESNSILEMPVYADIAAGEPIFTNIEEAVFYLPEQWVNKSEKYYILRVKGESMINADINDGDMVLIKHKERADNGDIVVATIDDSATLKRYQRMGSNIILMPENNNYEPIMINEENVLIQGVLAGVIKSGEAGAVVY